MVVAAAIILASSLLNLGQARSTSESHQNVTQMTAILIFPINENELKISIEEVIIATYCVVLTSFSKNFEWVYQARRTKALTVLYV